MGITPNPTPIGPSGYANTEWGFAPTPPPPPGNLPPGNAHYATPPFLTFAGLISSASRSYLAQFDQAMADSPVNALAMENDIVLQAALWARMRPSAQLSWAIEPKDETDPAEVEAAKLVTDVLDAIPNFQDMKTHLLKALWYGRYAVEIAYQWEVWRGRPVMTVRKFHPINGDKLRFKWDGTPGVLVYGGYPGTWEATNWGMCHFITDPKEREQYVVHEFQPEDADWTQPQFAGRVHGLGIRGRVYWFWWMKMQVYGLLMNYLERFSNGLTIFYYAAHDPAAKAEAEAAATQQFSTTALLYPRWNTENPDVNKVERLEVGTASPALLENLVTTYFDEWMTRYILGQTLSSDNGAAGLGSGLANLHADTLSEIIKYDAVALQETLQRDLVNVLYRYNAPGVRPGKFNFQIDSPNSEEVLNYAQVLYGMGMSLDEDEMYTLAQLTKPKAGSGIVSQAGAMNPAMVGGPVQGMPVAGAMNALPPGMPPQGAPVQQMKRPTGRLPGRRLKTA